MNKNTFRLVFSKKLGMLVPVAECATSQGKAGAGEASVGQAGTSPTAPPGYTSAHYSRQRLAATVALIVNFWGATWGSAAWAQALPQGGAVTSGQGAVSTSGNHMTIQQSTQVLGMNWQAFNIGAGNTVQFVQPNAQSVAVNQVLGNSRSEIFGNLKANGQVFLLNPNGVLFGSTAQVDVGALVASTARSINQDASGQWVLGQIGPGSIINQGHIRAADGGFVVLAGNQARNEGTIQANGGGVALAVGETVSIDISQGRQLKVKVDGALLNALAENKGIILADGGAVYLTATGREALLSTVVNNGGVIQARSLVEREGRILLLGTGGDTINSGTLDASGQVAGAKGGAVVMGGNRVALVGTDAAKAIVDVSGSAGGGRTIIGGDLLGKATDIASIGLADYAVVGNNAEIRIGSTQGDGGFVETSGKSLTMMGNVTGQSAGKNGQWLIDPTDITISTAGSTATNTSNVWNSTAATAIVNNASIEAALDSGVDVCVTTAGSGPAQGNITISANITTTAGGNANLTLAANRSIATAGGTVAAPRTISSSCGTLNVNLLAAQGASPVNGSINLTNAAINTNGGMLNMSAIMNTNGDGITLNNTTINISGGNITSRASAGSAISINNSTITTQGSADLVVDGCVTTTSGIILSGNSSITQLGSGGVNITGVTLHPNGGARGIIIQDTASLNQSGTGNFNITARALNAGALFLNTTSKTSIVQTTAGTMNIDASATSSHGVLLNTNGTIVQSGDGTLNIKAAGTTISGSGAGVLIQNNGAIVQSANGTLHINATAIGTFNAVMLQSSGKIVQSSNGTLNINTTRATTGNPRGGVQVSDTFAIEQSGEGRIVLDALNLSMAGTSFLNQTGSGSVMLNTTTGDVTLGTVTAGNLTVNSGNNISLAGNITKRDSTALETLNLRANRSIATSGGTVAAPRTITSTNGVLNVNLLAAVNGANNGNISLVNATINTNGGMLNMSANMSGFTGEGITLNNATVNVSGGNFTSRASGGNAITINNANITTSGAADLLVDGQTTGAIGVNLQGNGSVTQMGSGAVTIIGNTTGNNVAHDGIRLSNTASLNQSGTGAFNVTASAANGFGLNVSTTTNNSVVQASNGNMTISATSTLNSSVILQSNSRMVQMGSGSMNISGTTTSTNSGMRGIVMNGTTSIEQAGTGTLNITAVANAGNGLLAQTTSNTTIVQSSSGVMNINATSVNNNGLRLETNSTIAQAGSGTLNINTTNVSNSNTRTGVSLIGTSVVQQSGAGNIVVDALNFVMAGTASLNQASSGNITVNTTTGDVNVGIATVGNLTVNSGNNITLLANVGKRNSADAATLNLTANRSINITGRTVASTNGILNVNMVSANVTKTGSLTISNSNITTNGGNLNITAQNVLMNSSVPSVGFTTSTLNVSTGNADINVSGCLTTGGSSSNQGILKIASGTNLSAEGGAFRVTAAYLGTPSTRMRDPIIVGDMNTRGNVSINVTSSTDGSSINEAYSNGLLRLTGIVTAVNGNLNISSNASGASTYNGIVLHGNVIVQSNGGNISLTGSGVSGRGITRNGANGGFTILQNANSTITLTGTTNGSVNTGSAGISLDVATITQGANSGGGSITLNGIATGDGEGLSMTGTITQASNATLNLRGTAVTAAGVNFASGTVTQSSNGTVNVNGESLTGTGTALTGTNVTQSGTGVVNISGTSTDGSGLGVTAGLFVQSAAGTMNFSGSSTNGTGIATTGGVIRQSGSGNVSLAGTSTRGDGIQMTGATQLGTAVTNQTTVLNVAGALTTTTVNTTVTRTANTTFTDLIDVATTTVTNGIEVVSPVNNATLDGALRLNQTGTGNLSISGSSTNGSGVSISSAFINQGAGSSLAIAGTSTNGIGLAMGGGAVGNSTYNANSTTTSGNTQTVTNVAQTSTTVALAGSRISNVTVNTTNVVNTDTTGNTEVNRTTITTTTTSNLAAPRMVFNSTGADATIFLNGTTAGMAGVYVQGDVSMSVATNSTVVINGNSTSTAGPGVLLSGQVVDTVSSSNPTDPVTQSNSTSRLIVPVNLLVEGPGSGVVRVNGNSTSGPGVYMDSEATLNASGMGSLVINGTSGSAQGFQVGGAQLTIVNTTNSSSSSTGTLTINTTQTVEPRSSASSTNTTSTTVVGSSTFNVTLSGNVTVQGATSTGGSGIQVGGNPGASALYLPANTTTTNPRTFNSTGAMPYVGILVTETQTQLNTTGNTSLSTFNSVGNLTIIGPVKLLATGNLTSGPGTNVTVSGDATLTSTNKIEIGANLTTTGGNITVSAQNDVVAPGNITSAGNLTIGSINGSVNTSGGTLNAPNGNVAITATNGSATLGNVTAGNLTATAAADVTLAGTVNTTGNISLSSTVGDVSIGGNVTARNLNVAVARNITARGNLNVAGNTNLNSTNGSVILTGGNSLRGRTSVVALNGTATVNGAGFIVMAPSTKMLFTQNNGLDISGFTPYLPVPFVDSENLAVAYPLNLPGILGTGDRPARPSLLTWISDGLNKPISLLEDSQKVPAIKINRMSNEF